MEIRNTGPLHWKKRKQERTISEHLYHNLVQRRQEKGIRSGLTRLIPVTMKNSPSYYRAVCVLAWLCSVMSGRVGGKLKSWKQFWLKPQTNKWAVFPNSRLWRSLLHRALCNTSLGSSTTDYCSVCILFLNNLKASVQCEHWEWALQKSGCGTIASS